MGINPGLSQVVRGRPRGLLQSSEREMSASTCTRSVAGWSLWEVQCTAKTIYHSGVHCVSAGLVQLAALWCAGEPAEEGAVGAERCRSSTYQHMAPRPHHSGVETTSLAAGPETS